MNALPVPAKLLMGIAWIAMAVLGLIGVAERFLGGHVQAAYGSYVCWGLWVSAYIYFIGLSAGAFLLSSMIYVFGLKQLERIGKISLFIAVITLFMSLISIFFDLGREWRFYRVFTSPNFRSMMAWMVWLYNAYFLLLVVELWLALRPDLARARTASGLKGMLARALSFSKGPLTAEQEQNGKNWLKVLGGFGIPLAIAFHGGVGSLFGTISAHPYWHTPLMPILFLTGALVSGGALMLFVVSAIWPERDDTYRATLGLLTRVVVGLLAFDLILEWAEFSIPMWYGIGHEFDLMMEVLFGHYWYVFWIFHIGLGVVLPLLLIWRARGRSGPLAIAGLLIASMFLAVRLNLVIPALVDPNLAALESTFQDARLRFSYLPSFFEWQVTLGIVAAGMAIFYLGQKFLPLTRKEGVGA